MGLSQLVEIRSVIVSVIGPRFCKCSALLPSPIVATNARAGRGTRRTLAPVWVFWIFDLAEHLPLFNEAGKKSTLTMKTLRTVSPPLFARDVALSVKAAWEDWAIAHARPPA